MQPQIRHPQQTDSVSAGVAIGKVFLEQGLCPDDLDVVEQRAVTAWHSIISDTHANRVALASLGRRVVGYAALVPADLFGLESDYPPVRALELRFFGAISEYRTKELLKRQIDFVIDSSAPVQTWVLRSDRDVRSFLRSQGFVPDGAVMMQPEGEYVRLVR